MPSVILHLGLGAFHRAHQAAYLHALRQAGDSRWSLSGTNLRPDMADTLAALAGQQGRYTLETISPAQVYRYEWIESIGEVIPYAPGIAAAIARGADPATRIISFTVTEAGYYLDAAHRLDPMQAEIAEDIARVQGGLAGVTIYGAMAAILRARMASGSGPVTLLNCDNLRHNGERFRQALVAFLDLVGDADLRAWTLANTRCPNAMVDRITPRAPPALRDRVRQATGRDDAAPITAESFIQWVIEDDFCAGRPDWERVGVQMVASVQPWEEAKIRILNASHSAIAWAGTLKGLQFIHEGTHDPAIRQIAHDYVTEDVMPCLADAVAASGGAIDLAAYRDVVLERFGNPSIRDTNQRVAMDGFAKLPGFIAPTVRERLAAGASIRSVAMLPALFLAFLQRWHRHALPYVYQDQAMDVAAAHAICEAADPVAALCADRALWDELAADPRLVDAVRAATGRVEALVRGGTP